MRRPRRPRSFAASTVSEIAYSAIAPCWHIAHLHKVAPVLRTQSRRPLFKLSVRRSERPEGATKLPQPIALKGCEPTTRCSARYLLYVQTSSHLRKCTGPLARDAASWHTSGLVLSAAGSHSLRALMENVGRSEEHTSELQSLMRLSYAVFCLKKNNT